MHWLLVIEDDCGAEGSVFIKTEECVVDRSVSIDQRVGKAALASGSIPCESPTTAPIGWFSKIPEPLRSRLEGAALATESASLGSEP